MKPLPKAIFFDLDDTLISFDGVSVPVWEICCNETVAHFNLPVSGDALLAAVLEYRDWYWSDPDRHREGRLNNKASQLKICATALGNVGVDNPGAAEYLSSSYAVKRQEAVHIYPKSIEVLEALREKGLRLALLTNGVSREQRYKIERFGLEQYFEGIFIEEEMGFGKPDIRVFKLALETMALAPEDVWMVGDNLVWDIGAPQGLGIYTVWHDWRKKGLPEGSDIIPDKIITDIGELWTC